MNLRTIPRAVVGGYLKALRWPIDRTTSRLRGGATPTAAARADAPARSAAGAALGDEALQRDGARRSRAADERSRADTLERAADATTQVADQELAERQTDAERR